jgi:DDE superfamily endonuclease
VLSADEKPGVQARMRIHLPLPPGPARVMRAESEYHRFGTLAYLAAYDVHRAKVMGRCEPSTRIKPFTALVDQVMKTEPYATARRVFWVVDNGASHRNWAAAARLQDAYPNAQMVHLPVHASWLNQVEVYFSVIQRKLLTPTTSRVSMSSPLRSSPSRSTTTPPPGPSTGNSPAPTSTASWHASGSTTSTRKACRIGCRSRPARMANLPGSMGP